MTDLAEASSFTIVSWKQKSELNHSWIIYANESSIPYGAITQFLDQTLPYGIFLQPEENVSGEVWKYAIVTVSEDTNEL